MTSSPVPIQSTWPPHPWRAAIQAHEPGIIHSVLKKFDAVGAEALLILLEHPWPEAWDAWWPHFHPMTDTTETARLIAHAVHHRGVTHAEGLLASLHLEPSQDSQIREEAFLITVAMGWKEDFKYYASWGVDFAAQGNQALVEALRRDPLDPELITTLWPTLSPESAHFVFAEALRHQHLSWARRAWEVSSDHLACARTGIRHAFTPATAPWAQPLLDELSQPQSPDVAQWSRLALVEALNDRASANDVVWVASLSAALDADEAFRSVYVMSLACAPAAKEWAMEHLWPQVSEPVKHKMIAHTLRRGCEKDLEGVWCPNIPIARQMEWLHDNALPLMPRPGHLTEVLKTRINWAAAVQWSPDQTPTDSVPRMSDREWDLLAVEHVPPEVRRAWVKRWPERLPQAWQIIESERRQEQAASSRPERPRSPRPRT